MKNWEILDEDEQDFLMWKEKKEKKLLKNARQLFKKQ